MVSKFDFALWWQESRLHSLLKKIQQHPFIVISILVLLIALAAFIFAVYSFGWDWTGFTSATGPTLKPNEQYRPAKTLWDVLQLLFVPIILAIGGFWLNRIQMQRDEQTAEKRAGIERELARNNQEETLLQAYLDKMSDMLLKGHLGEQTATGRLKPEYEQVQKIARVRTITVLTQLDGRRVGYVFAFLREAGLMSMTPDDSVVSLEGADFHAVNWSQADLSKAALGKVNLSKSDLTKATLTEADLHGADFRRATLIKASFIKTDLRHANLHGATLTGADLTDANLYKATLTEAYLHGGRLVEADLRGAYLNGADLTGANLYKATLTEAYLHGANLKGATGIIPEELEKQAMSLNGTTMPNGSIHP